jgi:carboxyl-terminal processing protease
MRNGTSMMKSIVFLVVGIIIGLCINTALSGDNTFQQIQKLNDALNLFLKNYVEEVSSEKLVTGAINGMIEQLDPHSAYIPPQQMKQVTEDFKGKFGGIGIEFDVMRDTIVVVAPLSGGPSEALGIKAGDRIVGIDGKSAIGTPMGDVPKKLRGPEGTKVSVKIFRLYTNESLDFVITRGPIPLYSLDAAIMLDKEVGYVKLNRFAETTYDEFMKGLQTLKSQGMKRLILDLRNNPGGYMEQAIQIADEFLSAGKKIVFTKGRVTQYDGEYFARPNGRYETDALIVLIDRGSASASEIVAGAVQDWDRALIVGETSFGKGLVQLQFPLNDNSALRITTSRYYTPSGRSIQRPYELGSREDYYREVYRRARTAVDAATMTKGDSTKKTAQTAGGRTVYGGGGITPDYYVAADTVTSYTVGLLRQNVFFEFGNAWTDKYRIEFEGRFGKDFEKFRKEFTVDSVLMKEFLQLAESRGVKMNEEQFKNDERYIRTRIKADIARQTWRTDGFFAVVLDEDNVLQEAKKLFPEAMKLALLKPRNQ